MKGGNYTPFEIKDNYEECDYLYGGEDFIITAEYLIALANGKILNADVNMEYGFTVKLEDGAIQGLMSYMVDKIYAEIDEKIIGKARNE